MLEEKKMSLEDLLLRTEYICDAVLACELCDMYDVVKCQCQYYLVRDTLRGLFGV